MLQRFLQLDRKRLGAFGLVWLLYSLVAIITTWPMILQLRSAAIGDPSNDVWNHLWGFWWVMDELVNHHQFPVATNLLNHPNGGPLFFIDLSNALFSLPLQHFLGLTACYNLTILFNLTLNGFGAWLLANHLTRNPYASFVAGVIYGFSPHLLAQVFNGISETVNAGWLPIFMLFLIRAFQEARLSNALLAGCFLFMTTFANWYYGLFGLLFSVLYGLGWLFTSWRRIFNPGMLRRLFYLMLTYGLLISPVLLLFSYTLSAENAIVGRDPAFVYQTLIRHNMTDLMIFFHPGRFYSPDLKAMYGEDLIIVAYLGYTVQLLALLSVFQRRGRDVRFWAFLATTFMVLALGPFLYVNGRYLEYEGRWLPLPFLAFFHAFPLFSRISHAFRFVVAGSLALGILAAFALKGFYARTQRRAPAILITTVITGLILGEYLFFSPARFPIPLSSTRLSPYYDVLHDEPGDFAVLDLPIGVPTLKRSIYAFFQTTHGKRIPYGLNDPFPASLTNSYLVRYMVNLEFVDVHTLPLELPVLDLVASVEQLKALNYRYILVHDDLFSNPGQIDRVHRVLRWLLGPPEQYPKDALSVYRLN